MIVIGIGEVMSGFFWCDWLVFGFINFFWLLDIKELVIGFFM